MQHEHTHNVERIASLGHCSDLTLSYEFLTWPIVFPSFDHITGLWETLSGDRGDILLPKDKPSIPYVTAKINYSGS